MVARLLHSRPILRAALVAAALAVTPAAARAAILVTPAHSGSGIPAGSRELGAVAENTTVHAAVALAPRDPAGLAAYAREVSTPGSALYHQYLTVSDFAARFAPATAQVAAVRASLTKDGLAPGKISANGLTLPVTATAGKVESAFATSLKRIVMPDGRTAIANTAAPSLAPSVAGLVQGVVGLNTLAPTSPRIVISHARHSAAHATSSGGASQGCAAAGSEASSQSSYTTSQIANRYHLSTLYADGIKGSNVTVAVYELEPFSSSDIAAFQSCFGTHAQVSTVRVDGGAGNGSGSGEAAMDVEDVIGLAPDASVRVYEGPSSGGGAYDTYARIVSDNVAKVVTTSWGLCEADQSASTLAAENTLFEEAAVQGQTILASTGDQGTNDCSNKQQAVDDPSSQPWVTGVGASSIRSAGESVWNNSYGATGGGVSEVWARPSYQSAAAQSQSAITCGTGGTTCRETPDVTADGDPNTGYVIYYDGQWNTMGGTSISTPTWAALAALADSSPACAGRSVGFANPTLYKLAASAYTTSFNDVNTGNNGYNHVPGFSAGAGYDMASGLGTPNANALVPELCGASPLPVTSTTTPAKSTTAPATATATTSSLQASGITLARLGTRSSLRGKRTTLRLRARDLHHLALRYAASGLPRGLRINSRTGVITGRPKRAGTRLVAIRVTDSRGGFARATFRWRVRAPRQHHR
jgi:subtilase family serine protease